jgi:chorismate mutase
VCKSNGRKLVVLNYVLKKLQVQTKKRVETKAKIFGKDVKSSQEEDGADPVYKIKPSLVANLFGDWIMPLTFVILC